MGNYVKQINDFGIVDMIDWPHIHFPVKLKFLFFAGYCSSAFAAGIYDGLIL